MGLQLFADTATGQWLDRVTNDFGINREPATKALRKITTFDTKTHPMMCRWERDLPLMR